MSKKKNKKQEVAEQKKQEIVMSNKEAQIEVTTNPIPQAEETGVKNKSFFNALEQANSIPLPQEQPNKEGLVNTMSVAEYNKQKEKIQPEEQIEEQEQQPQEYNNTTISNRGFLDNLHQVNSETAIGIEDLKEEMEQKSIPEEVDIQGIIEYLDKENVVKILDNAKLHNILNTIIHREEVSSKEACTSKILKVLCEEYDTEDPLDVGAEYGYDYEDTLEAIYDTIQTHCDKFQIPAEEQEDIFEEVMNRVVGEE